MSSRKSKKTQAQPVEMELTTQDEFNGVAIETYQGGDPIIILRFGEVYTVAWAEEDRLVLPPTLLLARTLELAKGLCAELRKELGI